MSYPVAARNFIVFVCLILVPLCLSNRSELTKPAGLVSLSHSRVDLGPMDQVMERRQTQPDSSIWPTAGPRIVGSYSKLPLSFEVNQGQADPKVKFVAHGRGYSLFLTGTEAVIALKKLARTQQQHGIRDDLAAVKKSQQARESKIVRMQLAGASASPHVITTDELPGKVNYFIGNDPTKWRTNLPTYAKVQYQNVYPGVDLVYYGSQGQLEYDFMVAPGADPRCIHLRFNEREKFRIDEQGELLVGANDGSVRFRKPVVYQEVSGQKKAVEGSYALAANNQIAFHLGQYDTSRPLIIDPVLVYSSYLGGTGADSGQGIAVDTTGNAYVTGYTSSTDFPTANSLQASNAGGTDAFVSKLNPAGSALVYSTYLGGNNYDAGSGIAVDASGSVYLTGSTNSTNFPVFNGVQTANGGGYDVFVTKLNASGSTLVYSTYLGGYFDDRGSSIAVDASGNAYVTGYTSSVNFPTVKAPQPASGGGSDAFVAELNSTGSALVYSTYLGGSANDYSTGIAVDASGNAYVTGYTYSTNFPTVNAFQSSNRAAGNQASNAFLAKINAGGSSLSYCTYLGGSGSVYSYGDFASGVAVDGSGDAYVAGYTASTNFPTVSPLQAANSGGFDIFVSELNSNGSALVYSTYLGGSADDYSGGIAVDVSGNAYVIGYSYSSNFPTLSPLQAANKGGSDGLVSKLSPGGSALSYSTYLGGSSYDFGYGIAVDVSGNVYITGSTASVDFPTVNAGQPVLAGIPNSFVVKIAVSQTTTSLTSSLNPSTYGQPVTFTATVTSQASGTPTGSFTFLDGVTQLAQVPLTSGQATFVTSALAPPSQSISAQYSGDANFGPSTASLTQTIVGPLASASPSTLSFGQQLYNTSSAPKIVTVTNVGNATLNVSAISFGGLNPQDFAQTNTCTSSSISVGGTCQISITFTPTEGGNRSSNIAIASNGPGIPQAVSLTGVGIMPLAGFPSGTSLGFGNQAVGTTSAGQTLTVENNGTAPMFISSITISGPNNGDFGKANFCPLAPVSLAPNAKCSITVTFAPTAEGTRYASLTITDNVYLDPQQLGLVGTGVGQATSYAPTIAFLGGGSSSMFVELGQAAIDLNGGVGGACVWTQTATSSIVASDNRTNPPTNESGNIWVVWSPGTGTCAGPAGNFAVYSYMSLDTVGADRCLFEVDSSGLPGCVQVLTVAPNTSGSNLLCYPSSSSCSYFGDTSGGIPATVINTISNQHWFVAGTDLLPVDAKFATYRMLAPCGQQIWRQPFDQQLRGTYGLGYQSSAPSVGVPLQSFYSSATAQVVDFNFMGNDPITGLAVPAYSSSTIGAQPIVVVVSPAGGTGIGAATDIPGYVLMSFYNGSLGRATDLLGPTEPWGITTLVPEPSSGAYNVFEWSMVNNSQFHDSQDAYNCSGTAVASNPLNLQSLNGNYANSGNQFAYRRRVVGTSEMLGQLQAGSSTDERLGYFYWNAGNASGFTASNGKYLTVNGVDPLQNAYTDGVLPGTDAAHPLSNVTFKWLNMGDYPLWTTLRLVSQSPTPTGVSNLIEAAQSLNSIESDYIPVASLNVWHSHYYLPGISSGTAANGMTINPATPNDLCIGYLPEFGGDAGGSNILKRANYDFCADFGNITGLINKTN